MRNTDVQAQPEQEVEETFIPPLYAGDRLTRDEFERRYDHMPPDVKAELIEGVVYMPSPVRATSHGRPHGVIMAWLSAYWFATPGVDLLDNSSVRLDLLTEPQPDALLRIETADGTSGIDEDDYVAGAPELVIEVAASSEKLDLGSKLEAYRRNGIAEYVVWAVNQRHVYWFRLSAGSYVAVSPDRDGIIRSQVFPGLHLHVEALLTRDRRTLLATLQLGLASSGHAEFVQRLSQQG